MNYALLLKLNHVTGWLMLAMVAIFFITGLGMTRQVINPVFSAYVHVQVLPVPFLAILCLHMALCFARWRQKIFPKK